MVGFTRYKCYNYYFDANCWSDKYYNYLLIIVIEKTRIIGILKQLVLIIGLLEKCLSMFH